MPGGGTEHDFVNLAGEPLPKIKAVALVAVPGSEPGRVVGSWDKATAEVFSLASDFAAMFATYLFVSWPRGIMTPGQQSQAVRYAGPDPAGETLARWAIQAGAVLAGLDNFGAPFVYLGEDRYLATLRKTGFRIIAPFEGMDPVGHMLWLGWAMKQPHNPFLSLLLRSDLR